MRKRHGIGDARDMRWMLGLALLALAVRLIFILSVERDKTPFNDAFFYHLFATHLSEGDGFTQIDGSATAAWPPLYPSVLSLFFRVFGNDQMVGEVVNAFIGAATVALVYFVARRALGPREAVFSGVVLALLPSQIFFTDVLVTETLVTFMVVAFFALLVVLPDKRGAWAILGVAAALTALTRAEGVLLLVVPVAMAWKVLDRRELAVRTGIAVAALVLCIAPWTIRNAVRMDAFIPISNNFGQTLYNGHNDKATGGPSPIPQEFFSGDRWAGPAGETERQRVMRDRALNWAADHPIDEVGLIPGRLAHLVQGPSEGLKLWVDKEPPFAIGAKTKQRLGVLGDAAWFALLTLAIASIVVFGRSLFRNRLLLGAATYVGVLTILYGVLLAAEVRYRLPLEPLLILIAAPLAVRLRTLREKS